MEWDLLVVTPPGEVPVTLGEVKSHGRIDGDDEDVRLASIVDGVLSELDGKDGWLGRALITQTLRLTMSGFPGRKIRVPLPPLQSVSSITYLDSDEVVQTVDSASYRVVTSGTPGLIELRSGYTWPSPGAFSDAVRIEFVAGYGAAADVPSTIKEWILATVLDRYDNRAPTVTGTIATRLPFVDRMLDSFKVRTNPVR